MRKSILFALALAASGITAVEAQEGRMNTVVVTAQKINAGDLNDIPHASLRIRADFVLYELTYVNSTLDANDRKKEMKRMFNDIVREVKRHPNLRLNIGDVEASAAIETATFEESYQNYGNRGNLNFVVRANVKEEDSYQNIRDRVEKLVASAGEFGRSQSILADTQYLGINDLKSHRPALLKTIWDDVNDSANPEGVTNVEILGLEQRTRYRPVGPLELELFIPFDVEYKSTVSK